MPTYRTVPLLRVLTCLLACALAVSSAGMMPSQASKDERALWELERAYWRYVESNDLDAYRGLWHKNFLGWPSVSAAPVHKDHITGWITSQTGKGLTLKAVELKPAAIQVTGDVAMVCYWMSYRWVDKDGQGATLTTRITHAWVKHGNEWQIIGGMSMPEPGTPKQ